MNPDTWSSLDGGASNDGSADAAAPRPGDAALWSQFHASAVQQRQRVRRFLLPRMEQRGSRPNRCVGGRRGTDWQEKERQELEARLQMQKEEQERQRREEAEARRRAELEREEALRREHERRLEEEREAARRAREQEPTDGMSFEDAFESELERKLRRGQFN